MKKYHLLCKTRWNRVAFGTRAHYADLWSRLRAQFPRVIACCLMPDHVHLAIETADVSAANQAFMIVLHAFARAQHPGVKLWGLATPPDLIANELHRLRTIRYIHLNPCRDRLVADPLEWEWSTHREAVGAVRPEWMDLRGIEPERFHQYVSSDPSAKVGGTPLPLARPHLAASLDSIGQAVLMAMHEARFERQRGKGVPSRKIFIHLAKRVGDPKIQSLARFLDISPRAVAQWKSQVPSPLEQRLLEAAWLTLSDARLSRFLDDELKALGEPHQGL